MAHLANSPAAVARDRLHPSVLQAIAFTEAYQNHRNSHPARREAACLRTQFPALLGPIGPEDCFAGAHNRARVTYVGSIWWAMMPSKKGPGKQGGYCYDFAAVEKFARTEEDRAALAELEDFWSRECTWAKIHRTWDEELRQSTGCGQPIGGGGSGFVLALDFDRLLRPGLPGLTAQVRQRLALAQAAGESEEGEFLQGLLEALEVVTDCCHHYRREAREQAAAAASPADRARLERIADALAAIVQRPPATLFEAIQLWWIYSVMAGGLHIEGWRIDVALGDFYAADLDAGRLSEEQALELVAGLWWMIRRHSDPAVSRVMVGGRGRRNEAAADRFALAAMEATRRVRQVIPQLTLRFHDGQNPALLAKALDVLGEGCTYPMLYNDDVNIPGVAQALRVDPREAERYYPLGCGEYLIGGACPSLLSVGWSVPKSLEAVLRAGGDPAGRPPDATGFGEFADFPQLWENLVRQIERDAALAARIHQYNDALAAPECPHLLGSLLLEDCVARGRGILDGGARYHGACIMAHGFTNAADSLAALRHTVFAPPTSASGAPRSTPRLSLAEIGQALDRDFAGCDALHRRLLQAPKFGNDHEETDALLIGLWREVSRAAAAAGDRVGPDFLTVSSVNPGGFFLGRQCGATADGRRAGEPFAIGHAPTAGADRSGITALLNSVAKADPANGGATTNLKLARSFFTTHRAKLQALLAAYWKRGGMHATLTVVDQAELEDALQHPDRYPHLLVRVGGWSARFIDLPPDQQREIIRRTLY